MLRMIGNFCIANSTFVLFLTFSLLANAQDFRKLPQTDLRVEVRTNKRVYAVGESVRFTAILRNRGNTELYISKSFFRAGGVIAGFYVSIRQLTGKPSATACRSNGDRGMGKTLPVVSVPASRHNRFL
jgi:uncharacterized protein (DUF58 family)